MKNIISELQFDKPDCSCTLMLRHNSHLQGRLETIKGFESFQHTDVWLPQKKTAAVYQLHTSIQTIEWNCMIIKEYAADKDARWGAKSKKNIWFGYKRHTAVDTRYGLITKTIVTPANVLDYQVVEQICPEEGYLFMDKLYDTKKTDEKIKGSGCSPGTIRKNNNPSKNKDLDRWRSQMRMPYEGTFSKLPKRARYRGQTKVAFQNVGSSIAYNLKKALQYLPQATYL